MNYAVVRKDNGPRNPHTGIVSTHQSAEAAFEAIEKANRKLKKQAGYATAWHPYAVLDCESGEIVQRER